MTADLSRSQFEAKYGPNRRRRAVGSYEISTIWTVYLMGMMRLSDLLDASPALGSVTEEDPLPPKVPLTIITGFLGAGKSTLLQSVLHPFIETVFNISEPFRTLRYILSARHGFRIAVIVNEVLCLSILVRSSSICAELMYASLPIVPTLNVRLRCFHLIVSKYF